MPILLRQSQDCIHKLLAKDPRLKVQNQPSIAATSYKRRCGVIKRTARDSAVIDRRYRIGWGCVSALYERRGGVMSQTLRDSAVIDCRYSC
ncbi:MAG: hypothetical protein U0V70_03295 [Terriglobia bacterium]